MIEVTDHGKTKLLTINREARRNSIDEPTVQQLRELIAQANADKTTRALVITGAGTVAFCAGSDMKAAQEMTIEQRIEHALHGQQLMTELAESNLLTIAAVEGFALGGGLELALACDLIIAGDTALFGLPEVQRGAVPSWGGTFRVTKAVGLAVAKNMLLGGKKYSADEAKTIGLVLDVVPMGTSVRAALDLAELISSASEAEIFSDAKRLLSQGAYGSVSENSQAEFEVEKRLTAGENYGNLSK